MSTNSSELEKELTGLIEKNLPARVGKVLKERLDQADLDAALLKQTETAYKSRCEEVKQLRIKNEDLTRQVTAYKAKKEQLKVREAEILARENKVDVDMANLKASEAEKRAETAIGIVEKVFRSPVFKRSYHESNHGTECPNGVENGNYKYLPKSTPESKSINEEITEN